MGKYFRGREMRGISEPHLLGLINGTIICLTCVILCHTLRAWQIGEFKNSGEFKPDAVRGQPEAEPTSDSPGG